MSSTTTIKTGDLYVYRDEDRNAIAVSKACVGPNGGFVGAAICSMSLPNKYKTQSEINSLAQLFAAAPDLLEALQSAADVLRDLYSAPNEADEEPTELRNIYPSRWALIDECDAAIAKAGGTS